MMRLTCPRCGAQYEIDGSQIPAAGRTVECSACDTSWHYVPEDAGPLRLVTPAADNDTDTEAGPAPSLPPRRLNASVLSILREEAERELSARRREAGQDTDAYVDADYSPAPIPAPGTDRATDEATRVAPRRPDLWDDGEAEGRVYDARPIAADPDQAAVPAAPASLASTGDDPDGHWPATTLTHPAGDPPEPPAAPARTLALPPVEESEAERDVLPGDAAEVGADTPRSAHVERHAATHDDDDDDDELREVVSDEVDGDGLRDEGLRDDGRDGEAVDGEAVAGDQPASPATTHAPDHATPRPDIPPVPVSALASIAPTPAARLPSHHRAPTQSAPRQPAGYGLGFGLVAMVALLAVALYALAPRIADQGEFGARLMDLRDSADEGRLWLQTRAASIMGIVGE